MANRMLSDELFTRMTAEAERLGVFEQSSGSPMSSAAPLPRPRILTHIRGKGSDRPQGKTRCVPAVQWVAVSEPGERLVGKVADRPRPPAGVARGAGTGVRVQLFVRRGTTAHDFPPGLPAALPQRWAAKFLAWVIEARIPFLDAENIARIMCQRLPPLDDPSAWELSDEQPGDDENKTYN